MCAVHQRVIGQGRDSIQGGVHDFRRAFKQAPASGHEQCVAYEQRAAAVIGDVPARVTGDRDDVEGFLQAVDVYPVPVAERDTAPGDVLGGGAVHGHVELPEQVHDAAHVVGMVVGDEDRAGLQSVAFQRREDRRGRAGIDDRGTPAPGFTGQPDVIVVECGDWFNRHHEFMLASCPVHVNLPRWPGVRICNMPITVNAPSLRDWFAGPVGAYLLAQERQHVERVLPDLFGYHLAQVCMPGMVDLGESSRIHHRILLGIDGGATASAVVADPQSLPLATDSVDVLLLPHVLEFVPSPHRVLREAERTLIGEGHLLVLAFNPWSVWGLWHYLLAWRRRPPWSGRFYTVARLHDWLSLLDFEVVSVERFAFCPPLRRAVGRYEWLEHLGAALWSRLGAAVLVVARKRVLPLTPVRHRWQSRRTLIAAGLAEPSARGLPE